MSNQGNSNDGRQIVQDDGDLGEPIIPPPNRSTGGTPLRRTSPLVSPGSQRPPERQVSYEDLARRPRSNPRSRTPMRYESPLTGNAFREVSPENERREGQRVSIRALAGAAVGTALRSTRIVEQRLHAEGQRTPTKSSKQGPSRRKVRRWNNDNFVGLASELAESSSRGAAVAEILLLAQADAMEYRCIYNPNDMPPSALTTLIQDEKLEHTRNQFFEGEIGHGPPDVRSKSKIKQDYSSPALMMNRVHERLRNVITRACSSNTMVKIVDAFEECLCSCFLDGQSNKSITCNVNTLLEAPKVNKKKSGQTTAHFYFDADSSSAGFHRLLLHAVCQFHGLHAMSTTVDLNKKPARQLVVTGKTLCGPNIKLSDQAKLTNLESTNIPAEETHALTRKLSTVKVGN